MIMQLSFAGPSVAYCLRCHKALSNPKSISQGYGPICAAKVAAERNEEPTMQSYDLPFDPEVMDIVFQRGPVDPDTGEADDLIGCRFNIAQRHRHHSPTGMEWGYAGSGPADFALNILALFLPGHDVKLWDGSYVSQAAWDLHQPLKRDLIASASREGGRLTGEQVKAWIAERTADAPV